MHFNITTCLFFIVHLLPKRSCGISIWDWHAAYYVKRADGISIWFEYVIEVNVITKMKIAGNPREVKWFEFGISPKFC